MKKVRDGMGRERERERDRTVGAVGPGNEKGRVSVRVTWNELGTTESETWGEEREGAGELTLRTRLLCYQ